MSDEGQMTLPEEGTEIEATTNVESLVRLAIEKGVDVEVLERLVALQERVAERDARMEFFKALALFRERCPELLKSRTADIKTSGGGQYSYTYAPLDSIAKTVGPELGAVGLSYSWTTEPSDNVGILMVVCILRHIEGHEERATFPVPTDTNAAMSSAQKNSAALTTGQRQSLVSVLGITATDDTDAVENPEPITSDQIKTLNELITESGADYKRFLKYLKVGNIAEVTQGDYAKADAALRDKIGRTL